MRIHGLQKMTLLDFPGRVACTVFTVGCNFRCPFCHNSSLVVSPALPELSQDDFFAFLRKRQGLLEGVAITGGEPLLHPDMPELLEKIRALGYAVKLDTNGAFPERLKAILEAKLADYVAMDIKNSPSKYALTTGVKDLDIAPVLESIMILRDSGVSYEFRTTVVREFHEAQDFEVIGRMIEGAQHYFLQAFTDRDTVPFEGLHAPSADEMRKYAEIAGKYVKDTQLRGVD